MHLKNIENKELDNRDYTQKRLIVKKNKQTGKHFKEDIFLNIKSGMFMKDPNHTFKNKDYTPQEAIQGQTIIDLGSMPVF